MPKKKAQARRAPAPAPEAPPPPAGHNAPPGDTPTLADRVKALGERVTAVIKTRDAQTAELDATKDALLRLQRETIPALLKEMGGIKRLDIDGFTLVDKSGVEVAIPAAMRDEAHAWMVENGYGDIVNIEVAVAFGKGDAEAAVKLCEELRERFPDSASLATKVHAATLKSWGAERVAAGDELPEGLFKVHPYEWADIKPTKKSGD